jgi:hypothetical protein
MATCSVCGSNTGRDNQWFDHVLHSDHENIEVRYPVCWKCETDKNHAFNTVLALHRKLESKGDTMSQTFDRRKMDYAAPAEAGYVSTARNVGKRFAAILNALDGVNWAIAEGTCENHVRDFKRDMIDKLENDGWRVVLKANNRYSVLPPRGY